MSDWRRWPRLAALLTVVAITLQIAVPAIRLFELDRDNRYAWQMFAALAIPTEYVVVTPDGESTFAPSDVVAHARADIDYDEIVPAYLCDHVTGATSIEWDGGSLKC